MAQKKQSPRKKQDKPAAAAAENAVTPEQRYMQVEETAYYLAENDGFRRDPVEYWIEAEASMDA